MGIPNMFANPPLCTFKESFSFSSVFFFFFVGREGKNIISKLNGFYLIFFFAPLLTVCRCF